MIPVSSKLYTIGYSINNNVYQELDIPKQFNDIWDTMYAKIFDIVPSIDNLTTLRNDTW